MTVQVEDQAFSLEPAVLAPMLAEGTQATPRTGMDPSVFLTGSVEVIPGGRLLRKFGIDELPQLLNVMRGEMSLVGPRPCLFNQTELISERERMKVFSIRPGITGLAQVSGVNMENAQRLVQLEVEMIENMSVINYFKYIFKKMSPIIGNFSLNTSDCLRPNGVEIKNLRPRTIAAKTKITTHQ